MFPSNNQFGGPTDPNGGPFGGSGFGGPPSSDDMFAAMLPDENEDVFDLDELQISRKKKDPHEFLTIGLHFFESLNRP